MDPFEASLLNHRRILIAYMEEWSKQQENMLSNYALARDGVPRQHDGRPEVVAHTRHETTPIAEEPWVLFSEQAVCKAKAPVGERVAATGNIITAGKPDPDEDSLGLVESDPAVDSQALSPKLSETEGIKAALQPPARQFSSQMLVPRLSISSLNSRGDGSCVKGFVESAEFGFAISFVILSNVLFMSVAADRVVYTARQGVLETAEWVTLGEIIFTSIYVIELALKLRCYGRRFFYGLEWQWHIFDTVVVLAALADILAPLFVSSSINISYLRVNRLIKLVKMLRVVTVYRSFKELRLIIASILGCVKTMFWAIALLGTVLFTFSLLFVQAVTEYVKMTDVQEWNDEILLFWGSTRTAMITLFQSSTGGEDWAKVAEPLWDLGWLYYAAFMLYICFFMFIVVNILTALFVDAALGHSHKDDSFLIQEEMQNKHDYIKQLKGLYRRLDHDGSNALSWDDFDKGLHSPDMMAFASALDIEISDIREFFRLLSSDGRQVVDLEHFVLGCMKLKGSAKSLDVVSLLHKAKHLEHATVALAAKADGHWEEVKQMVTRVLWEQERSKDAPLALEQERITETMYGTPSTEQSRRPGAILNCGATPSHRRFSLLAPDFAVP